MPGQEKKNRDIRLSPTMQLCKKERKKKRNENCPKKKKSPPPNLRAYRYSALVEPVLGVILFIEWEREETKILRS